MFALTKIAASTWGCSLARAREVYTKVIRSAIAYGASAYHTPADPLQRTPRGVAKGLATVQSSCLRVVAGAYRATPVRSLETETWIPPLDLYLNKRLADFEARLANTGKLELLRNSRKAVATAIRNRRVRGDTRLNASNQTPTEGTEARAAWAAEWLGTDTPEEALERDWRIRWQRAMDQAMADRPGRDIEPADHPDFTEEALSKHIGLKKHESSMLVQARTGKIGLRDFLHTRKVPGVTSPGCQCGAGRETAIHILTECRDTEDQRTGLRAALGASAFTDRQGMGRATSSNDTGAIVARWLLGLGRLPEFRLAIRLAGDSSRTEDIEREAVKREGAAAGPTG